MTKSPNPFDQAPAQQAAFVPPPSGDGTPPRRGLQPPATPPALRASAPASVETAPDVEIPNGQDDIPGAFFDPDEPAMHWEDDAVATRKLVDILIDLHRPLPPTLVSHKPVDNRSGAKAPYLQWQVGQMMMDRFAPGWSTQITDVQLYEKRLYMVGKVCIPTSDFGVVCRTATGTSPLTEMAKKDGEWIEREISYGDPSSNAEAMMMMRGFRRFGLGLYLTLKTADEHGNKRPYTQQQVDAWYQHIVDRLRVKYEQNGRS